MKALRIKNILKVLLDEKEFIPVKKIAETLSISNNTIRNNLDDTEKILILHGLRLKRKRGMGIKIEGPDNLKSIMSNKINYSLPENGASSYTSEYRIYYLLMKLFMSDGFTKVDCIADNLFVSHSTIQNDIQKAKLWLKKYDLNIYIRKKSGIKITGSENNCRKAISDLILTNNSNTYNKAEIDSDTISKIQKLVNINCKYIERIISRAEDRLNFKFSDESYTSLAIHIAISIRRIQDGNQVKYDVDIKKFEKSREYDVTVKMARDIEKYYNIKFSDLEIKYLFLHIIGTKIIQNPAEDLALDLKTNDDLAVKIAKEIIAITEKVYSIDFTYDKQFLNGLIIHLRPAINRLEYGLSLKNPLLNEIKKSYPKVYGTAWMANEAFERYLGKTVSDEEIGYIAMHIGAALERSSKSLRTVIICSSGMGTAQLLATKLENRFKQIKIIDVQSYASFKENPPCDVDLVLSTIPIKTEIRSLIVSPILTPVDINNICLLLDSDIKDSYDKNICLFDKSLIFTGLKYKDKNMLIKDMCSELYKKHYIREQFCGGILKREKLSPTEIGMGVAIPHAAPEYVNKSAVLIAILKEPIKWDKEYVDIVIFIAFSKSGTKKTSNILKKFYTKLNSKEFLNYLRTENDKVKLEKTLNNLINN